MFDVLDHTNSVEIIISFQTMPRAVIFRGQVAFRSPGSIMTVFEDAAGAETQSVAAWSVNDKPFVLAFFRFVHLGSAHGNRL